MKQATVRRWGKALAGRDERLVLDAHNAECAALTEEQRCDDASD